MSEFWVHEFGAAGDGTADDGRALRAAVAAAAEVRGDAAVRLRPGVYRVTAEDHHVLTARDIAGLSIVGEDSVLMVAQPGVGALHFAKCRQVKIAGITIDHERPPFAQGTVVAVDPQHQQLVVDLDPRFPLLSEPHFQFRQDVEHPYSYGAVFSNLDRRLKRHVRDALYVDSCPQTGALQFALTLDGSTGLDAVEPGDAFVYLDRGPGSAFSFVGCDDVTVEYCEVLASRSVFVHLSNCDGDLTVRNCRVAPPAQSDRLVSTDGGGFHIDGCRRGPTIENCHLERMMDDGANVYARPVPITGAVADLLEVGGVTPFSVGDEVEVVDLDSGIAREVAVIESVAPSGSGPRRHIRLDRVVAEVRAGSSVRDADVLVNRNRAGDGFRFHDNVVRYNRQRGVLVKASYSTIERNEFVGQGSCAVYVGPENAWPEGPTPHDVLVRDNSIVDVAHVSNAPAVMVSTRDRHGRPASQPGVARAQLINNEVRAWRGTAVQLASVTDCDVLGTRLVPAATHQPRIGVEVNSSHDVRVAGTELVVPLEGVELLRTS